MLVYPFAVVAVVMVPDPQSYNNKILISKAEKVKNIPKT